MEEKMYRVRLHEFFSERQITESDRMTYEEAKKAKEYLDRIFSYDVYVTIDPD